MTVWQKLQYFTKGEKNIYGQNAWGDPDRVSPYTLLTLDEITHKVKQKAGSKYKKMVYCLIHCAWENRESGNHPKGTAIDFHFDPIDVMTPFEAYEIIIETLREYGVSNFVGLGVYPNWKFPGFHLDTRIPDDLIPDRWSRVGDKFVNNIFVPGEYVAIEDGVQIFKGA